MSESLVTYTAVIAVRYPELDNVQNGMVCFGNYLLGEQATSGGFLPVSGMPPQPTCMLSQTLAFFFWLGAAWVKSRAARPSVSEVNEQLHVQIGCKLRIRNREDELTKQARRNKLRIKPEGNSRDEVAWRKEGRTE